MIGSAATLKGDATEPEVSLGSLLPVTAQMSCNIPVSERRRCLG